jgi:DNA-binding NtrC family response regulator
MVSTISLALTDAGFEVSAATTRSGLLQLIGNLPLPFSVAVLATHIEDVVRMVRRRAPDLPIVTLLDRDHEANRLRSLSAGAVHSLTRAPLDLKELIAACWQACRTSVVPRLEAHSCAVRSLVVKPMIGNSLDEVRRLIARFGPRTAPVLILGETGTGKELVARLLHEASGRSGPFTGLNCGAVPENLVESELFGHVKGAFTGASESRDGLLQYSIGGTVLLDEINSLPWVMQSKLLRFLQDHEVRKVGANSRTLVDVRILAASNEDLEAKVARGGFRSDLFYRLNVLTIEVPPLRQRGAEEILLLASHILTEKAGVLGTKPPTVNCAARDLLTSYSWPGNVRELESALERALALCEAEIKPEDLPAQITGARCQFRQSH